MSSRAGDAASAANRDALARAVSPMRLDTPPESGTFHERWLDGYATVGLTRQVGASVHVVGPGIATELPVTRSP